MAEANSTERLIRQLDEWIRAGEGRKAKEVMLGMKTFTLPRSLQADMASLARRLNLDSLALQILNRIVRPAQPIHPQASQKEKLIYASILVKIGAYREAFQLFDEIDRHSYPEVLLFTSFANFRSWKYKSSEPLLQQYIRSPQITEYQRLIGQLNLAAVYVAIRDHERGTLLLKEIMEQARAQNNNLVYGNALELKAQQLIHSKSYAAALDVLKVARDYIGSAANIYEFFMRKWVAVAKLLQDSEQPQNIRDVQKIRREAIQWSHWETVRECDLHIAMAVAHRELAEKVYFATPYRAYRKLIKENCNFNLRTSGQMSLQLDTRADLNSGPILDLRTAQSKPSLFKPGSQGHKLFGQLVYDIYRPLRQGDLFGNIFPNEYFDPFSSPQRLAKCIHRLRQSFREVNAPLKVEWEKGFLHLQATAPWRILVRLDRRSKTRVESQIEVVKSHWSHQSFTSRQAAQVLNVSPRQVVKILRAADQRGELTMTGRGKAIRYRFCS